MNRFMEKSAIIFMDDREILFPRKGNEIISRLIICPARLKANLRPVFVTLNNVFRFNYRIMIIFFPLSACSVTLQPGN